MADYKIISVSTISRVTGRRDTASYGSSDKRLTVRKSPSYYYDVPHLSIPRQRVAPNYSKYGSNTVNLTYDSKMYGFIDSFYKLQKKFSINEVGDTVFVQALPHKTTRLIFLDSHSILEVELDCLPEDIISKEAYEYIESMGVSSSHLVMTA